MPVRPPAEASWPSLPLPGPPHPPGAASLTGCEAKALVGSRVTGSLPRRAWVAPLGGLCLLRFARARPRLARPTAAGCAQSPWRVLGWPLVACVTMVS